MAGCICKSSGFVSFLVVGIAGVAAGVVGSRALEARPGAEVSNPVVAPTSFVQPEGEMTPEQMMEVMKEWAALAPEHASLQQMVGTWDCAAKFWMDPAAPPMETKGQSVNDSVLGGRFVTQHFTMPDFMGMPFEGMGAVGFDKQQGKFVNVWVDNFGTAMILMTGDFDKKANTWTWHGKAASPMGESEMKHVVKCVDADHTVMEFWESNAMTGGEFIKTGEITYSRSK